MERNPNLFLTKRAAPISAPCRGNRRFGSALLSLLILGGSLSCRSSQAAEPEVLWSHQDPTVVGFTPDGEFLVTQFRRYRAQDGASTLVPAPPPEVTPGPLLGAAISPDGSALATSHGEEAAHCNPRFPCSYGDGLLLRSLKGEPSSRYVSLQGPAVSLDISPDGETLATGSAVKALKRFHTGQWMTEYSGDFRIRLWNPADGTLRHTSPPQTAPARFVRFSPDGQVLASLSRDSNIYRLYLWSVPQQRVLRSISMLDRKYRALDFSPDGTALRVRSNDGVRWLNVSDGRVRKVVLGDFVHADEKVLVARSGPDVSIYRTEDVALVLEYAGLIAGGYPPEFLFGPDHRHFMFANADGYHVARFNEPVPAPPLRRLGDVARDDVVNVLDVVRVLRMTVGLEQPEIQDVWAANLNRDGRIDIIDAVFLLRHIVGEIEEF